MGLHTGLADPVDPGSVAGGYFSSQTLNRVSRIMSAGHGGQILLSLAAEELSRDALPEQSSLQDLGEHHLRDVIHPEHLFELKVSGLPAHLTDFIGRGKELSEIDHALAQNRLVTIVGAGGTGKTRLAVEAGVVQLARVRQDKRFCSGVYFVALASLEDRGAIVPAIASALGFSFYEGGKPRQQLLDYLRKKIDAADPG